MKNIDKEGKFEICVNRWVPVILCMGAIFCLSSQSSLPDVPGLMNLDFGDKIEHAIAYGVLGGLIWRALSRNRPKWWQVCATVIIAVAYGFTDESHQRFIPDRNFDMLDLTADALGSAIAAITLTIWMGGKNYGKRTRTGKN